MEATTGGRGMMKIFINYPFFRRVNGCTLYRTTNPVYSFEFCFSKTYSFHWCRCFKSSIGAMGGNNTNDKYSICLLGFVVLRFFRETHILFDNVVWSGTEVNESGDVLFEEYGNDEVPKFQRRWKIKSLALRSNNERFN